MSDAPRKSLFRKLLGASSHNALAAFFAFFTFPIIARVLGIEAQGAWALIGAAGIWMMFVDLGLGTAVQRAAVKTDHAHTYEVLSLALLVSTSLLPVVAVGSYLLVAGVHTSTAALGADMRHATMVVIAGYMVFALANPYRAFVIARDGLTAVTNGRILGALAQLGVLASALVVRRSLLVPAWAMFASQLVENGAILLAARAIDPHVPFVPRLPRDRGRIVPAFRDGAASLVVGMAVVTALRVDLLVLASVAPLAVVAFYNVGGKAVDQAYLLAKQGAASLMPELGDPSRRAEAVRVGTMYFGTIIATGMAALALDGHRVLVAWVGPVASSPLVPIVTALLGFAAMLMSSYEVASSMVTLGARTAWTGGALIVAGSAANLAISLAGARHFGIWAVAGSTVVGNAVTALLMWRATRRLLGWRASDLVVTLGPVFGGGLVSALVGAALYGVASRSALGSFGACVAAMSAGCAAVLLVMRVRRGPAARVGTVRPGPAA